MTKFTKDTNNNSYNKRWFIYIYIYCFNLYNWKGFKFEQQEVNYNPYIIVVTFRQINLQSTSLTNQVFITKVCESTKSLIYNG